MSVADGAIPVRALPLPRLSDLGARALGAGYCLLFFAFLFGPLVIMVVTAFNSSPFPRLAPWDCFTTAWFGKLMSDRRLLEGLGNSLVIGAGVVLVATPVGLAGAVALSEVGERLRPVLYAVLLTPLLAPGVVIGISTLIFWDRVATALGAGPGSLFHSGTFLTVLGQVTFIAAYAMLIFLARLQRFDRTLTEAALDLGATPGQAFRRILLPFLRPAIGSAAVLAFLASVENYNTTVFTIVSGSTFTTVLASKVRFGIDPSISAVAVVIIALTLIGAMVHEAHVRRGERQRRAGSGGGRDGRAAAHDRLIRFAAHPATVATILVAMAVAAVWAGARYDSTACEARLLEAKRAEQQRLIEAQRARQTPASPAPATAPATPAPAAPAAIAPAPAAPAPTAPKPSPFGGAFAPDNLSGSAPAGAPAPAPGTAKPAPFGGAFAPDNLKATP